MEIYFFVVLIQKAMIEWDIKMGDA